MNLPGRLERRSNLFWIITGFVFIGCIGVLDFLTGYEFTVSLFYLIPISILTWFAGQRIGISASIASTIVWLLVQVLTRNSYLHPAIYAWNTLIELSIFLIIVFLLTAFRKALITEKELAQTDYLTGAVNSRWFYGLLQMEINRSQRYNHPFTIAYFDVDNFKAVNDQFGHAVGDQVLRNLGNLARAHLRKSDVFGRLGGDEFALLLPESDLESAQVVLSKIQGDILAGMQQMNMPISLSIGALTCLNTSKVTPDEILISVDDLMYSVKRETKNAIKFSKYIE